MVSNSIFAENYEAERVQVEKRKYGRLPSPQAAAHPHSYERHSFPIPYGQFDEPSQEIV
jgi:hypothetical protein